MADALHSVVRYELLGRLARGGMAEVYLCRALGVGGYEKLCVIKKIRADLADTAEFVEMFMDEASISARLQHRSIGQVFDFGRVRGTYIIAMEYIHGVTLRQVLRRFANLGEIPPVPMAAFILAEVCAALHHAHTRTSWQGEPLMVIHRDVNPRNVMVTLEGEVKLIDFGIAKATQRSYNTVAGIKGKVSYMSPEQASGSSDLDRRSDIFSAGIILFELLTGRKLFDGDNDLSIIKRVEQAQVPAPSSLLAGMHPALERICMRALQRDRRLRYATAREMQEELEEVCFEARYGSCRLAAFVQDAFAERLQRVDDLIRGATSGGGQGAASPEGLLEPTDLILRPEELEGTSGYDEPTHLFVAPEGALDITAALSPAQLRTAGRRADDTLETPRPEPTISVQVRPGNAPRHTLPLLVTLAAAVSLVAGVLIYVAGSGPGTASPAAPGTAPRRTGVAVDAMVVSARPDRGGGPAPAEAPDAQPPPEPAAQQAAPPPVLAGEQPDNPDAGPARPGPRTRPRAAGQQDRPVRARNRNRPKGRPARPPEPLEY